MSRNMPVGLVGVGTSIISVTSVGTKLNSTCRVGSVVVFTLYGGVGRVKFDSTTTLAGTQAGVLHQTQTVYTYHCDLNALSFASNTAPTVVTVDAAAFRVPGMNL